MHYHQPFHLPRNEFWRDIAILLAILAWLLILTAKAESPKKIAILNRDAVVLAWYNSPQWAAVLRAKRAEQSAAEQQGNTAKVQQLKNWGNESQQRAHQQMFQGAPIDDILAQLKPCLDEIKSSGGYEEIVLADKVGTDVTEQVLVYLKATERTRKMIADLKR
jgi:G:T/U-mismatch repair DNA glycosylase